MDSSAFKGLGRDILVAFVVIGVGAAAGGGLIVWLFTG